MSPWHSLPLDELYAFLRAAKDGLQSAEAEGRLKKIGPNVLPEERPLSKTRLFLRQFTSPLMYILLGAVGVSFALGHTTDAGFILVVIFLNTSLGFYQEYRADQALRALKRLVPEKARALRDGLEREIEATALVPGDAVLLQAGDRIPADGRLIESRNLVVNEANLTGEWVGVRKSVSILPASVVLADRENMVFASTVVESGEARIIIVSTGTATEVGRIVSELRETPEGRTPLQKKMLALSKITGLFILVFIALVVGAGLLSGESMEEVLVASLALAVSAIPEGLLPIITVVLVLGMRRILKAKGLVRKLVATETLGSVTVICTDKTGTLTEGKMQVARVIAGEREFTGDGPGDAAHLWTLSLSAMTNGGFIENPDDALHTWRVRGTPTERALINAAAEAGVRRGELLALYPVLDRVAFSSECKYALSLHGEGERRFLSVLGAPEILMARAAYLKDGERDHALTEPKRAALQAVLEGLTANGFRVVACAEKRRDLPARYATLHELAQGLTFIGLIALRDPLRPEAKAALKTAKRAGIKTIMITGDHVLTAQAVAAELDFGLDGREVLLGGALEVMSDEELERRVLAIGLYARVSPHHKLRIVRALEKRGEIVAMLGDGVNDAPALKAAAVGVALGSGTDVAKEAADLVLLDDGFKTVVRAVEEGRVAFQNIRKVFIYLVADDFSELFLFLGAMIMGLPLPLLPAQILWINLVEDGLPGAALATESEREGVMENPPRPPEEPILNGEIKRWMGAIFIITGIAALFTFLLFLRLTDDLVLTRTAVFALMCLDSLLFAFNVRSFRKTIFGLNPLGNRHLLWASLAGLLLLFAGIYLPILQKILHTVPLSPEAWGLIILTAVIEVIFIAWSKHLIFLRPAGARI